MSHPGASHKSISIADQSTTSEKVARHVMLEISFLIGIRTHLRISNWISRHRQGRVNHEDRRDRRHRPDRLEDRRHLRQGGHEAVAASPKSGINTITGEGLKEAMAGAQVVIDLANSPSFEDKAVLEFFETSGRNLLAAEAAAGVRHHVALSIVGTDRTPENGYFRAKIAQEKLIEASGIPYTIIRATQFLEFLGTIAATSADGNLVRLSPGLFQPIAADDVAAIVADVALAAPRSGIVEIAGPERAPFNEIIARYLKAVGDPREVVSDPEARYWGGRVEERSLVPLGEARLGRIGFDEWFRRSRAAA
jgi:uncharacterized protein YbjT (DUF2867 family)